MKNHKKSIDIFDIRMNNRMFEWYNAIYARKSNNVHAWSTEFVEKHATSISISSIFHIPICTFFDSAMNKQKHQTYSLEE